MKGISAANFFYKRAIATVNHCQKYRKWKNALGEAIEDAALQKEEAILQEESMRELRSYEDNLLAEIEVDWGSKLDLDCLIQKARNYFDRGINISIDMSVDFGPILLEQAMTPTKPMDST